MSKDGMLRLDRRSLSPRKHSSISCLVCVSQIEQTVEVDICHITTNKTYSIKVILSHTVRKRMLYYLKPTGDLNV